MLSLLSTVRGYLPTSFGLAVLVLSFAFGVACVLPNIWQRFDTTYPFQGVEILGGDQEQYYASRIREVEDGNWMLGSTYYAEEKTQPFLQPPLPEWVMGGLGILIGLTGVQIALAMKFLFGALLFFMMTLFCVRLSSTRWLSLLAVTTLLFAGPLTSSPSVLGEILGGTHTLSEFLRFARLTNPQFSSMLFFLGMFFLADWIWTKRLWMLLIFAFVTGLSFYAYPYTWSFLLAVVAFLMIQYAWRREWKHVRALLIASVAVFIIALPSLLHTVAVMHHPLYPQLSERLGMVQTHAPVFGYWLVILLGMVLFFAPRISGQPLLVRALGGAALVAMNQQVLTGVTIVPHHYHWYYVHPIAILLLVLLVGKWCMSAMASRCSTRVHTMIVFVLLVAGVALGVRFQWESYVSARHIWGERQQQAGVLSFLANSTTTADTVYAYDFLREFIPIYTSADVYHAGNANIGCLCSFEHLRDVYFFDLWMEGVTPQQAAKSFFAERRAEVSGRLYGIHYREAEGGYDRIPDALVQEIASAYAAYSQRSFQEKLRMHPLQLIVLPLEGIASPAAKEVAGLGKPAYQDSRYRVWDLSP